MTYMYIGIDPGKNGGIAAIEADGNEIKSYKTVAYDEFKLIATVYILKPERTRVVVERVGAMPGQGVTSTFNFGKNFGFILGVLESFHFPYELVTPQKWKREFGVTADKNTSIEVCKRLFPDVNLKRTERCTKDHDGMAEALLLAEFCRRHMK